MLEDVGISPMPGELTAVIGASGSGKSTLLHVLSGLIRPNAGRVSFGGTDVSALPESRRDRWRRDHVGIVFQNFHLIDELSPRDNVLIAGWFDRFSAASLKGRADQLLEKLEVPPNRRRLNDLSRGEQQRVALARALMFDPPVILADEPTASLDRDAGGNVAGLLRDLAAQQGRTIVVATHDPELIAAADTVVALARGKVRLKELQPA